jgi:hypothetical protein
MPGSFAVSALVYCFFCTSRISNMPFGNTMLVTRNNSMKNLQAVVLDGEDWLCPRVRDMFIGNHLGYSVANCRMVRMF